MPQKCTREAQHHPHVPAGCGRTGKSPEAGTCAAIASAVGQSQPITLTCWLLLATSPDGQTLSNYTFIVKAAFVAISMKPLETINIKM